MAITESLAVEVEQVESDEYTLTTAEKEIAKHRTAIISNAGNLAIEYPTLDGKATLY